MQSFYKDKKQKQGQKQSVNSFLKDYKVAAISSSSRFLVNEVLKEIPENSKTIVEHGAGDGVVTKKLLRKFANKSDFKIFLIEQNDFFFEILKDIKDNRVELFKGYSQDFDYKKHLVHNDGRADVIMSSIPFFFLTESEREKFVKDAYENLKVGGKLVIFHQYRLFMRDEVKKYFKDVKVKFVLRNILPCFIIVAQK